MLVSGKILPKTNQLEPENRNQKNVEENHEIIPNLHWLTFGIPNVNSFPGSMGLVCLSTFTTYVINIDQM